MKSHTPGPWAYCARLSGSENHKGFYIKSNKFVLAHEVIPVDSDGNEGEANARLIAAAPELLEALMWYVENDDVNIGQEGNAPYEAGLRRAQAAIAKAKGEK